MAQISIIKLSEIKKVKRFDAECFVRLNCLYKKFKNIDLISFANTNYIKIIDGDRGKNYPNGDDFSKSGYCLFLNTSNVLKTGFSLENSQFITKEKDEILGNGKLEKLDIVFTTRGTIGNIGIYNEDINYNHLRINSGMVIFRLNNLIQEYFFTFLLTDFFKIQIEAYSSGSVQKQIPIDTIKKLKIPILPHSFQLQIEKIVKEAHHKQTQSQELYRQAEQILLEELVLLDFQPQHKLFFETTKKAVEQAKRFDAEYFQPKYSEIIKKIENYKGGFCKVGDLFKQNKALSKKDKSFYNYIEISDINISNGDVNFNKIETSKIPANGKRELSKNDLLISKVRPYRGAISFIDFEKENLLGSGAFTVLQEKTEYKKEVLMIFLKTTFIKELLLRYNCGTSYPVIKDEDILNLKIPLINPQIQREIAALVQKSHQLRKESKVLLEEAKKTVEEAIEDECGKV